MLSVATLVLSDAYDRLNAGANLEKQRERAKQGGYLLSAPCAAAEETGACEMQVCIRSAANLPGRDDAWPRKPAPESWVKVELGGRLVCKVTPLALPLATRGLRLERLATPPHRADRQARQQRDAALGHVLPRPRPPRALGVLLLRLRL